VLLARELRLPPDPLGIARLLQGRERARVALLHAAETGVAFGRWSYVAADPDRRSDRLDALEDDPGFEGGGESALASVPRWIGVVPYEHRRELERASWSSPDTRPEALISRPEWHRYPAVVAVDHDEGRVLVVGSDRARVDGLARTLQGASLPPIEPCSYELVDDEPASQHEARIVAAKALILAGDLYQVNLARRIGLRVRPAASGLSLYLAMAQRSPTPFGAYLELDGGRRVISTSPELLLRAESAGPSAPNPRSLGLLVTAPIKGSRPRGRDAEEDRARVEELERDPKENAELAMIIDVVRNDLGKVAVTGSVRLTQPPHVVTHRTIHHRLAQLAARAKPGLSRGEILRALVPSGSVTGAPKVRAMEVIASLEARRRGLYTGGLGYVAHDGSVSLSMAIRTAVLADEEGEYFTGGGIVADSDPSREVEETRWKALQLTTRAPR
jgi:anthranilate/para-aminobenzoate synthase component I